MYEYKFKLRLQAIPSHFQKLIHLSFSVCHLCVSPPQLALSKTIMATTTRHPSRKMSKQHFKVCFCFGRMFRLKVVEPPDEINSLFEKYSYSGVMSMDDMCDFLVEFQGEKEDITTQAQTIFDSLKHLNIFQRRGLHADAFFRYLLSDLNGPLAEVIYVWFTTGKSLINQLLIIIFMLLK